MKILIDKLIPYTEGVFEPYFQVSYQPSNKIDENVVKDIDVLFIRTRTFCNKELLEGSKVKVIATATIGTDHIDMEYCKTQGITVYNSKGCNTWSVVQYILMILMHWGRSEKKTLKDKVVGIIGVGSIGSKLNEVLQKQGIKTLLNDPFLALKDKEKEYVDLDYLLYNADIITLHVPYTTVGEHPTRHLIGREQLSKIKQGSLLINASRGGIVKEQEAMEWVKANNCKIVTDCWEGEPSIDIDFASKNFVGTPHIAGYSKIGKLNATKFGIEQILGFFKIEGKVNKINTDFKLHDINDLNLMRLEVEKILRISSKKVFFGKNFEFFRNSYFFRDDFSEFFFTNNKLDNLLK